MNPSVPHALVGAVLAGGASRRFGAPKERHTLAGVPLAVRALRTVRGVVPEVALAGARDVAADPAPAFAGISHLTDRRTDAGPLAGLEAALLFARDRGADGVVVLACDLPMVAPPALAALMSAWAAAPDPRGTLALASDPDQPLCAVWGCDTLAEVQAALDAGRLAVRDVVAALAQKNRVVPVAAAELAATVGLEPDNLLANVNRREDLVALAGPPLPVIVTVTGWKDSGKTSVAVALVAELAARGIDAVAAKHGHGFRFDAEGTDSWRLRHEAGARAVLLAGPNELVLQRVGATPGLAALVRTHLADAEVVIAEGWKSEGWPTIEVRAATPDAPPLSDPSAPDVGRRLAGVDAFDADLGARLADLLVARFGLVRPDDQTEGGASG